MPNHGVVQGTRDNACGNACDNSHASGAGADEIENKYEQLHSNSMELHMAAATALDSNLTINEIVTRFPETIPVFNRFGLDICCGGGVRVDEAAQRDGLDAAEVLSALRLVLERR
jgi:regulator of cell morphogenesis and NO signaling